jgi:nucleotide-binding universal stress UspA family protein
LGDDVAGRTLLGRGAGPLRELAVEERAALLVVGTRGHGALRSAVEGSVSGELAADAPCPVVVARSPIG